MNCNLVTMCIYYDVSHEVRSELQELADDRNVSTELLIESFIISPAHPEAAFPRHQAEKFLEKVIGDIHISRHIRVSTCIHYGDQLKVAIDVPKKIILEMINERG